MITKKRPRLTRQRQAILDHLRRTRSHPTADEIYDAVRKAIPSISMGTVYRNLHVLQQDGAVSVLDLQGSQGRYEVKQASHYHFRCEFCGRVLDLDEPVDPELDDRISRRTGFIVSGHQTEFRGRCADCRRPSPNN
jgi:Fur family peroxide stress response transcriptional regulator